MSLPSVPFRPLRPCHRLPFREYVHPATRFRLTAVPKQKIYCIYLLNPHEHHGNNRQLITQLQVNGNTNRQHLKRGHRLQQLAQRRVESMEQRTTKVMGFGGLYSTTHMVRSPFLLSYLLNSCYVIRDVRSFNTRQPIPQAQQYHFSNTKRARTFYNEPYNQCQTESTT